MKCKEARLLRRLYKKSNEGRDEIWHPDYLGCTFPIRGCGIRNTDVKIPEEAISDYGVVSEEARKMDMVPQRFLEPVQQLYVAKDERSLRRATRGERIYNGPSTYTICIEMTPEGVRETETYFWWGIKKITWVTFMAAMLGTGIAGAILGFLWTLLITPRP